MVNIAKVANKVNEERVVDTFIKMAKVNAPSLHEKPMAEHMIPILEELGFTYQFDEAHKNFNGDCGNLIAWWEGTDPEVEPFFLSAHLDTVLPTKGLTTVIQDETIYTDGTTILGADDREAIAIYIEAIRVIQENNIPCGPLELILTVNEQKGLIGSKYMDYSLIKSKSGMIFDSDGDVGQIILQGGYSSRIHVDIKSKSSHIGLDPEVGVNAFLIAADALKKLKLGKINEKTLANIGTISGGTMSSIIPGDVNLVGEVRSLSKEEHDEQLETMKKAFEETAKAYGATANVTFEKKYLGWKFEEDSILAQTAINAAKEIEIDYYTCPTLGGADTNILNEHGVDCITLGNGYKNLHTVNEYISIENVVNGSRLTVALILEWYRHHKK